MACQGRLVRKLTSVTSVCSGGMAHARRCLSKKIDKISSADGEETCDVTLHTWPENVKRLTADVSTLGRMRSQPENISYFEDDKGNKLPSIFVEGSFMRDYHSFVPFTIDLLPRSRAADLHTISLQDILNLLNIPQHQLTITSALTALTQVLDVQAKDSSYLPSSSPRPSTTHLSQITFAHCAVVHHLCSYLTANISSMSIDDLFRAVTLVTTSVYAGVETDFIQAFNSDLSRRLSREHLSVSQTCQFIAILSQSAQTDHRLVLDALWGGVSGACSTLELDESNLCHVYRVLPYTPKNRKWQLLQLVEKRTVQCFWKLSVDGVMSLLGSVCELNYRSRKVLHAVGGWLRHNMQLVSDRELRRIIYTLIHFSYRNDDVIKVCERYVAVKKGSKDLSADLISTLMEYLGQEKLLSKSIMRNAAEFFCERADDLSTYQIHMILKQFGNLYYLPPNANTLFKVVEHTLHTRFNEFPTPVLLDMFNSFTTIQRFPVNFITRLFNPFSRLYRNLMSDRHNEVEGENVAKQFKLLDVTLKLEYPGYRELVFQTSNFKYQPYYHDSRLVMMRRELYSTLVDILPDGDAAAGVVEVGKLVSDYDEATYFPIHERYLSDFILHLDRMRRQPQTYHTGEMKKSKLALLITLPEHIVIDVDNEREHLTGDQMIKSRHLSLLGYQVIRVKYSDFDSIPRSEWKSVLEKALKFAIV